MKNRKNEQKNEKKEPILDNVTKKRIIMRKTKITKNPQKPLPKIYITRKYHDIFPL